MFGLREDLRARKKGKGKGRKDKKILLFGWREIE
jgi:hypothetical protein